MTWEEVCDSPYLQDLPFPMELNKWGNIEMYGMLPTAHSAYKGQVSFLLRELKEGGIVSYNGAINTIENTKVTDIIWISFDRRRASMSEYSYTVCPEICVEVLAPDNALEQQLHKGQLYLQAGAEEFWLCDLHGAMRFFNAAGSLERSALCPAFPLRVELPDGSSA